MGSLVRHGDRALLARLGMQREIGVAQSRPKNKVRFPIERRRCRSC